MVRFMRAPPGGASRAELRRLADEELVQLVAASDADAFEIVFERHADAAFALAYRMCGRRSVAEDVAQEAFLALWRGAGRYDRTRGSVRTWLLGVVRNRAIDVLRRDAGRAPSVSLELDRLPDRGPAAELTDTEALRHEAAREVRGALSTLFGSEWAERYSRLIFE